MSTDHDDLVANWKANVTRRADRDHRFLFSLEMSEKPARIDHLARQAHNQVFSQLDCKRCANCCKVLQVQFNARDIERIAAHVGLTPEEFREQHLQWDEEDREYYTRTQPCPFLGADDLCTIYAIRPTVCQGYPYTDSGDFTRRIETHLSNRVECPAVYHVIRHLRRRS